MRATLTFSPSTSVSGAIHQLLSLNRVFRQQVMSGFASTLYS
ncbi:MAG TPA: hypothetical protein V6D50_23060 [Chroococcales cyanobacterium]